jgi:polyhydroxyalkanoate synthesis regulator phasin
MAWHPWILKDLRTDVSRCWNLALAAKQYAEVNVTALRELVRQHDRQHRELEARVSVVERASLPDPVSEKVTDKITDSLRDLEEHVCNTYDRVVVDSEAISALGEQVRELQARVTALEQQPPGWLPKNRHVEL